ncbi:MULTISPECIES: phage major capsid protein [unclassified Lysobacter]|uniref:phage major capsid protein n=1 Tax=unclassified Lysobacter TaxID=2635362 RepID=UPI0006FA1AF5|nr:MULTISPECIES: phage major capsid protein [unclassified Lysobacter]KRC34860.1 hypothetical protein ASE10_09230 [Lysobacter sp. Root76]KRD70549.1 hypothetical protein ASE45_01400 [Lysobacter sp. Root96]
MLRKTAMAGAIEHGRKNGHGNEYDIEVKAALDRISGQVRDFIEKSGGKTTEMLQRLQDVEQKIAGGDFSLSYSSAAAGFDLQTITEDEGFKAFVEKSVDKSPHIRLKAGIKALINDPGAPDSVNGTMPANPQRIPGYHGYVLRPVRLIDLLPAVPQDTNTFEYVRLGFVGDAEVQDGEGAEKAEMDFEGTLMQDKVATIAVHTTASAQILDDETQLQNTLQNILSQKVRGRIEQQLTVGSGTGVNIEGLYTAATTIPTLMNPTPDRIGEAITAMETAGYTVNVILMNPADWLDISVMKDEEGRYLYGNPASPAPPTLWNRPVVTIPDLPRGTALVGDTGKVEIRDRMQPTVFISRDHKDYRTRNLVLILVEARIGLAILDALAFRRVDLSPAT